MHAVTQKDHPKDRQSISIDRGFKIVQQCDNCRCYLVVCRCHPNQCFQQQSPGQGQSQLSGFGLNIVSWHYISDRPSRTTGLMKAFIDVHRAFFNESPTRLGHKWHRASKFYSLVQGLMPKALSSLSKALDNEDGRSANKIWSTAANLRWTTICPERQNVVQIDSSE